MSKSLPNYREKQHILYIEKRSEHDLIAYGDALVAAGKISDAIEFYQKANYITGLEKIKELAEQSGDVMLFQQVLKPLKQTASDETWNMIGGRAYALNKYSFALHAFEKSNNIEMIERVNETTKPEAHKKTA